MFLRQTGKAQEKNWLKHISFFFLFIRIWVGKIHFIKYIFIFNRNLNLCTFYINSLILLRKLKVFSLITFFQNDIPFNKNSVNEFWENEAFSMIVLQFIANYLSQEYNHINGFNHWNLINFVFINFLVFNFFVFIFLYEITTSIYNCNNLINFSFLV